MKRILISLLVAIVALPMTVFAQYSATFRNDDAAQALSILRKATGYDFVYQKSLLDGVKGKVSGSYNNVSLDELFSKTLQNQLGLDYKIVDKNVSLSKLQKVSFNGVIKGSVTDEQGEALIGATVMVKGTNTGVAADIDGNFSINVDSENPVLIASYVGMNPAEVRITSANKGKSINFVLKPAAAMMQEVVVTGYQELKKEKVTGAVTTISSDKLDDRYTTNLTQNLEGRVAGLSTYGGKPIIRGLGTLHGSSNPLLVVDGLPTEGSIDDLNIYDIASVNVLKDAAAAAIYGARAANGIIVVTTKNAKKQGKIDVDFSTDITVYENVNLDYHDNFYMTPEEHINAESKYYEYYFFNNGGKVADPIGSTESALNSGSGTEMSILNYEYYKFAKGDITRDQLNSTIAKLKQNNYARDYGKAMYHRQVIQQYNLSVRNSSDKFRGNLVLNYKKDNQQLRNHGNDWLNVFYKGSYDMAKWLTANFQVKGIYANSKSFGGSYNAQSTNPWYFAPYTPFYEEDGSVRKQYYWYSGTRYWTPEKGCEDLSVNPIQEMYDNTMKIRRQRMSYNAELLFKITDGLTANAMFIYETENQQRQHQATESSHLARTIKNAFAYVENGAVKYMTPENGGMLQTTNVNGNYWTARFQANYKKTFLEKHDIDVIAGLEFRETKENGTKSLALGYDEQLQNSATHTVDFGKMSQLRYAPYYMGTSGGFPCGQFAFEPYLQGGMGIVPEDHHRYGSGYFNATYTYDSKYNVFGSFRKDYADVYGLDAKYRGKPLWSVGAGWNIHNEGFMHDITFVNFLKLRASYGVTGNIYQGASSLMVASTGKINSITNLPLAEIISPANPDLRWEQNRTTNIGLDFTFLNYRLKGSIDWYNKVGKDIFHSKNLDPTYGFTSMYANVASIRNRGVEIAIGYDWFTPANERGFSWNTSMTFTFNNNEVTEVENDATKAYELINTPYKEGYPVNAMWSYPFAQIGGLDSGYPGMILTYGNLDALTHSGSVQDVSTLVFSGQSDPKRIIAMTNTLRWNGFGLDIAMAYYGGHKIRDPRNEIFAQFSSPLRSYYNDAWTPENPTNIPGIGEYASNALSSEPRYMNIDVLDGSFLKIRNIGLTYSLPKNILRPIGFSHLQLRFQVNDPKAIWIANDRGVDPETGGIRSRASYVFGLNVNI